MKRFHKIFKNKMCNVIGMIHIGALPGTPKYAGNLSKIVEKAKHEAHIYTKHQLDAVLIENMHDLPYIQERNIGPEIVTCMTRIASEIKEILPSTMPCGIQVLAGGNKQALAISKACNLQFIRAEGFVFGHVADEGYMDACAGDLLRYRRLIDAENILVFTDIKKKHSSHSITEDTSLLDTAKAAEFFLSDGIILTGTSTGKETSLDDLNAVHGNIKLPILIGSGVNVENLSNYFNKSQAVIVGSYFKIDRKWENDLCEENVLEFVNKLNNLRHC